MTSERDLDPQTTMKVYAAALKLLDVAMELGKPSSRLTITLDLHKGFDLVEKQLKKEMEKEDDMAKQKKLEAILRQVKEQRDIIIKDAQKRFLH